MSEEQTTPARTEDTKGAPQPERRTPKPSEAPAGRGTSKDEDEEDRPRRVPVGREFGKERTRFKRRRKVSYLTINKIDRVDYKDVGLLRRFLSDQGKILSSRQTGTTAKQQRMIARAVRRAREMALVPFVALDTSSGDPRGRGDRRGPRREYHDRSEHAAPPPKREPPQAAEESGRRE